MTSTDIKYRLDAMFLDFEMSQDVLGGSILFDFKRNIGSKIIFSIRIKKFNLH